MVIIKSFYRVTVKMKWESVCEMPGAEEMTINDGYYYDGLPPRWGKHAPTKEVFCSCQWQLDESFQGHGCSSTKYPHVPPCSCSTPHTPYHSAWHTSSPTDPAVLIHWLPSPHSQSIIRCCWFCVLTMSAPFAPLHLPSTRNSPDHHQFVPR